MAKKRLTPMQRAYKHEVDLLKRRMKRAKEQGAFFSDDLVIDLTATPRRVTKKAIARVHNLRGRALTARAQGFNPYTGEIFKTFEAAKENIKRYLEEQDKKKIDRVEPVPGWSDIVIETFWGQWAGLPETYSQQLIGGLVRDTIDALGKLAVAEALDGMKDNEGFMIKYENVRTTDEGYIWINEFLQSAYGSEWIEKIQPFEILNTQIDSEDPALYDLPAGYFAED